VIKQRRPINTQVAAASNVFPSCGNLRNATIGMSEAIPPQHAKTNPPLNDFDEYFAD
jgi:hypothetical protein